jgi:hypothetical protein
MNANDRTELLTLPARESRFERELTRAAGRISNLYIDCKRSLYHRVASISQANRCSNW